MSPFYRGRSHYLAQLTTLSATVPSFTCENERSSLPLDSRFSVSLSLLTSAPAFTKHLSGTPMVCHLLASIPPSVSARATLAPQPAPQPTPIVRSFGTSASRRRRTSNMTSPLDSRDTSTEPSLVMAMVAGPSPENTKRRPPSCTASSTAVTFTRPLMASVGTVVMRVVSLPLETRNDQGCTGVPLSKYEPVDMSSAGTPGSSGRAASSAGAAYVRPKPNGNSGS